MTERELQREIVALIKKLGYKYYAVSDSRRVTNVRGYPDLTIVGKNKILFRELKVNRAKMRAEQDDWLMALRQAGADAGYWWPEDLESGAVWAELVQIGMDADGNLPSVSNSSTPSPSCP